MNFWKRTALAATCGLAIAGCGSKSGAPQGSTIVISGADITYDFAVGLANVPSPLSFGDLKVFQAKVLGPNGAPINSVDILIDLPSLCEMYRGDDARLGTAPPVDPGAVNTGSGAVTEVNASPVSLSEVWTLTALTPPTTFSVIGSVSGVQANAIVGANYNNGLISFKIVAGGVSFVAGDDFAISIDPTRVVDRAGNLLLPLIDTVPDQVDEFGETKFAVRCVGGAGIVADYPIDVFSGAAFGRGSYRVECVDTDTNDNLDCP
jgi:hypothetical protein